MRASVYHTPGSETLRRIGNVSSWDDLWVRGSFLRFPSYQQELTVLRITVFSPSVFLSRRSRCAEGDDAGNAPFPAKRSKLRLLHTGDLPVSAIGSLRLRKVTLPAQVQAG